MLLNGKNEYVVTLGDRPESTIQQHGDTNIINSSKKVCTELEEGKMLDNIDIK